MGCKMGCQQVESKKQELILITVKNKIDKMTMLLREKLDLRRQVKPSNMTYKLINCFPMFNTYIYRYMYICQLELQPNKELHEHMQIYN